MKRPAGVVCSRIPVPSGDADDTVAYVRLRDQESKAAVMQSQLSLAKHGRSLRYAAHLRGARALAGWVHALFVSLSL